MTERKGKTSQDHPEKVQEEDKMSDFDFELAPSVPASRPSLKNSFAFQPPPWATEEVPPSYEPSFSDGGMPSGTRMPVDQIIRGLNEKQKEAALTTQGPLIVLAGAGSGKTKMLTSRVAYLIGHLGVPPYRVLAVTFTNKAAHEMAERVRKIVSGSAEIGTFHSVCLRILRRELQYTPFKKPFVIYDDGDQMALIKQIMKRMNLDTKAINPKSIQGSINRAKCDALEPHEVKLTNKFDAHEKRFLEIYTEYQKNLFANNAIDFGEILCMTYRLFRDNPEVRTKYQQRYQYIHVDEYQDTNRAQYLLLSQLAHPNYGGHSNICVVGDEDQSIYKWRGADIKNILDFEKDYPQAKTVKLEQNYRSTKNIITGASHVIGNNSQRKEKVLWTDNEEGSLITHVHVADERAEAEFVIAEIKRACQEGSLSLNDTAIFYRTHAQSRQFEDVLRREKILYQIVGGLRFYDRKEIKDVLAYFKVIFNPSDSVSLKRILNVPARGIGKTTEDQLDEMGRNAPPEPQLELGMAGEASDFWSVLNRAASAQSTFSKRTAEKISHFVVMMRSLMEKQPKMLLSDLYHEVLDRTGYVPELKKENSVEAQARIENLEEFSTLIQEFEEGILRNVPEEELEARRAKLLETFLEQTTLASGEEDTSNLPAVRLMTLHGAKGLEFPYVFMVGLEEGLFPSIRPWEETDEEDIEEERRLCYVGMTRAKQRLFMSNASVRRLWGQFLYQDPARFLSEIPAHLMNSYNLAAPKQDEGLHSGQRALAQKPQTILRKQATESFGEGSFDPNESVMGRTVDHPEYGKGRITASEGIGVNQKVTVEFTGKVKRKFLLRFIVGSLK